jgi:phosphohistidine phosphatase SixA
VRAKQTASIIGDGLNVHAVDDARLAGGFNPRALRDILRDHAGARAVMLVGHEPAMSATIGRVIGDADIDFKKGAIACVEINDPDSPSGTLQWMAPPKLLTSA